jgi:hypothetical protein
MDDKAESAIDEMESFFAGDDYEQLGLDHLETGLSDEELQEVIDNVESPGFEHSGVPCKIEKRGIGRAEAWRVSVLMELTIGEQMSVQEMFNTDIYEVDSQPEGTWVVSRVRGDRNDAEDEVKWLAEQVVMIENDPRTQTEHERK